jgi:hypothetical protein
MELKGIKQGTTFLIGTFKIFWIEFGLKIEEALGFEFQFDLVQFEWIFQDLTQFEQ